MIILRVIILALLAYIGFRILRWGLGGGVSAESGRPGKEGGRVEDVLVEDPVCGRLVARNQAVRLRMDKTTHYFCSEKCCDTFTSEQGGKS